MALPAPGMASADALDCEPASAKRAIARQCGDRIGRAARLIAAAWRNDFGRAKLPRTAQADEQPSDHFATRPSAPARSLRRSEKSRSIPPTRPIITWSDPANPLAGITSRASSRKRRFIRFRTTALPTFFVTVNPTRFWGSPSSRSRTRSTNPGVAARRPAFAARKSERFRITASGFRR